jgi:cytochrome c556
MVLKKISMLALAGIMVAGVAGVTVAQAQMTPDEAISARKDIMRSNGMTMRGAGGLSGDEAIAAATTLVDNFDAVAGMFPEGSDQGDTKALPVIWSDFDGFVAALGVAQEAAAQVLAAAEAGDSAAYGSALQALGQACGGCHGKYRAP